MKKIISLLFYNAIKNKAPLLVGAFSTVIGVTIFMRYNQLQTHLPPALDWADDFIPGVIYTMVGLFTMFDALTETGDVYVRYALYIVNACMFAVLTASYALDGTLSHHVSMYPFTYGILFIFDLMLCYELPGIKQLKRR